MTNVELLKHLNPEIRWLVSEKEEVNEYGLDSCLARCKNGLNLILVPTPGKMDTYTEFEIGGNPMPFIKNNNLIGMGKSMKTDDENIVPTLNEIKANLTKDIDASIIVLIRSIKHIDEVELFHVPMTEGLAQGRLRTRQQL